MAEKKIAVIGGGIIGLALAWKLLRRSPGLDVTVFEKEDSVGSHQSSHNSGVLHAGLYYKPGSLKAQLAVRGIREMRAFCEEHAIPHEICGKLVVACSEDEVPRLRELMDRGGQNGLQGLQWLSASQLREIEPHAAGIAAVRVPEEGIADYGAVCNTLAHLIREQGGKVHTGWRVQSVSRKLGKWRIAGTGAEAEADFLFNCAGLHCDRIASLCGETLSIRIIPFRGEYYLLNEDGTKLVRNLIYPVPEPRFPFLGVHLTRMIRGGVEAGPNAVLALSREGYRKTDFSFQDAAGIAGHPGFWRFLARYPAMCWYELRRSLSVEEFCRSLQRLVPAIRREHLLPGGAGVRAQAVRSDGTFCQDFECLVRADALHLLNAPSPGATASLAIADYLIEKGPLAEPRP